MAKKTKTKTKTAADITAKGWKPGVSKREFIIAHADKSNPRILELARKQGIGLSKSYLHKVKTTLLTSNVQPVAAAVLPIPQADIRVLAARDEQAIVERHVERMCLKYGYDTVRNALDRIKQSLESFDNPNTWDGTPP